ncbi:hypothetical protein ACFLZ0_00400 [Patescibacteria group bacterium]
MQMSTFFNYPPGYVYISFGVASINDSKSEFRIVITKGIEYREHKKSWMDYKTLSEVNLSIPRNKIDKIYIEIMNKENKKILKRYSVNIKEKWPENAFGDTSVNINWWF